MKRYFFPPQHISSFLKTGRQRSELLRQQHGVAVVFIVEELYGIKD
jgi:hypothetical protein